ncbi:uncharacterized protein LOC126671082 [Mercurialis annua]|uniref:uncharacterized protein LOC126671082 n=1 Tax=Mercurialis annua TaxID=3986 RepID=UPI00215F482E|nr:uncharacterized protein LOC126671082 [Mercurialis annua]XP_050220739.1 uncharacterized protein LOC126671082 [Mercurialis annua]
MDKRSKGMSWLGRMYSKFEDTVESMCLGVEDILQQQQEGLEYVENKLQTVRANVKQICSEIVQEILPISENSVETEYSLAQESDDSEENEEKQFQLLTFNSVAVTSDKKIPVLPALSAISEDILKNSFYNEKQPKLEISISDTSNNEYPSSSISSTTSEDIQDSSFYKDEQLQLEMLHYITSDDENLSSSVSSLTLYNQLELSSLHPDDLLEYFRKKFPLGYQSSDSVSSLQSSDSVNLLRSSDSVNSLQSFQSAFWGSEDDHSDVSDELVEKSDKSIDETKLDESWIVGDSSELSFEEEKLAALTAKEAYDNEHAAACREFESSENEGEGHDECESGEGHDECESGEGHYECECGEGHDERKSGEGHNECDCGEGHDECESGEGHNECDCGEGHDECESEEGHDECESEEGHDESREGHEECESDEGHDESESDWVIV